MRKILIPENSHNNSTIEIRGNQFHHLVHVLRIKRGETLKGISRNGLIFELSVHRIENDAIVLKPLREIKPEKKTKRESKVEINLYQAIPKLKKMDTIVRQSVETGVSKIIPIITQYTISIPKGEREISNKITRWQKIANEAVEQSGNLNLPIVVRPIKFKELIETIKNSREELFLLFHPQNQLSGENRKARPLHHILSNRGIKTINLLIGPEGGFSTAETKNALSAGADLVSIGNTVFRTETAAIFAISAVSIILLERESWMLKETFTQKIMQNSATYNKVDRNP